MSHLRNRSKIRKPFSFSQGFAQPLVSSLLGQSQVSGGLQRVVGGMCGGGGPGGKVWLDRQAGSHTELRRKLGSKVRTRGLQGLKSSGAQTTA